jgi:hypothetical protein
VSSHSPSLVLVVLGVFGALVYTGSKGRAPDKGSQTALKPTDETYLGVRSHDDRPEGTIEITGPSGDPWSMSLYAGGVPYQERGQISGKPGWTYKYTIHRYPIDYDADLGAWAGARVGGTDGESGLDIGLRFSPVRFLYGSLAPDLLVSPKQAGLGVSLYPPAQTVGYKWQHFGLGLGYVADYDGGHGWIPYLALSTRF